MKSIFFFISLLTICLLHPEFVVAQDNISLRINKRDNYSRATFGWKENVEYSLDKKNDNKLVIEFNKNANIDSSNINLPNESGIRSIDIISKSPLKVALLTENIKEIRDFKIGKRVVVDIYFKSHVLDNKNDLESNLSANVDKEAIKKGQGSELSKLVKNTINNDKTAKLVNVENNDRKTEFKANPPAIVFVPEHLPEIGNNKKDYKDKGKKGDGLVGSDNKKQNSNKELDEAVKEVLHVISLQSIKSISLAVFESHNKLSIVVDENGKNTLPSLNSPKVNLFSDFTYSDHGKAGMYEIYLPKEFLNMKAKGGGLFWDLIMGEKVKEYPPVKLKWSLIDKFSLRGGRLFIPLKDVTNIVDVKDNITGQVIKVAIVSQASKNSIDSQSYIDFDILRSPVGLAVRPKIDDLKVIMVDGGIEISSPMGLAISSLKDMNEAKIYLDSAKKKQIIDLDTADSSGGNNMKKSHGFYRFNEWAMGDDKDLAHNANLFLSSMKDKSESLQIESLLTLGKMYLSHGRGAEALGYFNYASSELPKLEKSAEFRALRGLAKALDWKSDLALEDFLYKPVGNYEEVKYWKSYILADLGDWSQAASVLPDNYKVIYDYPSQIGNRLALALAEVNLRDGNVGRAQELMALLQSRKDTLLPPQRAALKYLTGEANRQNGNIDKTKKIWGELVNDKDDLYRTKARLALAILLEKEGDIDNDDVIDRLERIRYAWRGDELEAQIHYFLGRAYLKNRNFLKGLSLMRDAASVAGDTALGEKITSHMADVFSKFFLESDMSEVSAVDAVTIYEQFRELTPVGEKGDKLVQRLAEYMVNADLLDRASKLLRYQVKHRLKGSEKVRVAIRLAVIELLNKNPQKAMNALGYASSELRFITDDDKKNKFIKEIALLKIRAYSQNKQYDKALSLLEKLPVDKNVNRLKADISWQAGYWEEAAYAIDNIIMEENISDDRPLSKDQQELILNRAIALNLADDRIALANMRKKFIDAMSKTDKAHQFEVITRSRNSTTLADRETLLSIVSEVDLFKKFLDSYGDNG